MLAVYVVAGGQQFVQFGSPQLVAANAATPHVSNPWSQTVVQPAVGSPSPVATASTQNKVSDAEFWLNSTASQIDPFAAVPNVGSKPASNRPRVVNGSADLQSSGHTSPQLSTAIVTVHHNHATVTAANQHPSSFISTPVSAGSSASGRQPAVQSFNSSRPLITNSSGVRPIDSQPFDPFDSAFDSAWAAKTSNRGVAASTSAAPVNNPFQTSVDKVMPAFEVKL